MIRKFLRNLLLRCLFLAFTGDQAVELIDDGTPKQERSAAAMAIQALEHVSEGSLQGILLPVTTYEVVWGNGF